MFLCSPPIPQRIDQPCSSTCFNQYIFCYIFYTSFPAFETSFQFGHRCSAQEEQPGPEAGTSVGQVVMLMVVLPCDDTNFSIFVINERLGEPESR